MKTVPLTLKDGLFLGCSYFITEPIWSILLASSTATVMLEIRTSLTSTSKQLAELFGRDSVYRGFHHFISVILSGATLLRVCLIRTMKLYPEKKNCHLRSKSNSTYFWMVLILAFRKTIHLTLEDFSLHPFSKHFLSASWILGTAWARVSAVNRIWSYTPIFRSLHSGEGLLVSKNGKSVAGRILQHCASLQLVVFKEMPPISPCCPVWEPQAPGGRGARGGWPVRAELCSGVDAHRISETQCRKRM